MSVEDRVCQQCQHNRKEPPNRTLLNAWAELFGDNPQNQREEKEEENRVAKAPVFDKIIYRVRVTNNDV